MNIAICEDNERELLLLRSYCERYSKKNSVDAFLTGGDLDAACEEKRYDVVFLDIEMPPPDGMTLGRKLAAQTPKPVIFFTTWHPRYAVDGYGIALRYLLKPISVEIFERAMELAEQKLLSQRLRIRTHHKDLLVPLDEIAFIEIFDHSVHVFTVSGQEIGFRGTLSEVAHILPAARFVRVHKSFCVNLDHVESVTRRGVIMTTGALIHIGRAYHDSFYQKFNDYIGNRFEL